MASQQQLKHRIGSVRNTRQITKAMELVAASKMRRAQQNAIKGRDYATLAQQLLSRLREITDVSKHPLFEIRGEVHSRLHIIISSDLGKAGAYDPNILKAFTREVLADQAAGIKSHVITIGRKAANLASKLENVDVLGSYTGFPEAPTANDLRPILSVAIGCFLAGMNSSKADENDVNLYDRYVRRGAKTIEKNIEMLGEFAQVPENLPAVDVVDILFTNFKSSIAQEVAVQRLLPAAFTEEEISPDLEHAVFEPNPQAVLNAVTLRLIEVQLFQKILESLASEQSARMLAMKNASDNASDIIDDLTLAFNTARQAAITQELAEITGGAEAIA